MIRNETIDNLLTRRSIRKYKDECIKPEELETILEVGKYAASGGGRQPGLMVVVQDPELVAKLEKLNAKYTGNPDGHPFYGAKTVICVLANTASMTWVEDGSLMIGNLMEAAHAIGVDSCWIHRCREMFDDEEGRELLRKLGVGDEFRGVGNCILGYRDCEYPDPKPRKDQFVVYAE